MTTYAESRQVWRGLGSEAWGTERLGTRVRSGPADAVFYDLLVDEWRARRTAGHEGAPIGFRVR